LVVRPQFTIALGFWFALFLSKERNPRPPPPAPRGGGRPSPALILLSKPLPQNPPFLGPAYLFPPGPFPHPFLPRGQRPPRRLFPFGVPDQLGRILLFSVFFSRGRRFFLGAGPARGPASFGFWPWVPRPFPQNLGFPCCRLFFLFQGPPFLNSPLLFWASWGTKARRRLPPTGKSGASFFEFFAVTLFPLSLSGWGAPRRLFPEGVLARFALFPALLQPLPGRLLGFVFRPSCLGAGVEPVGKKFWAGFVA